MPVAFAQCSRLASVTAEGRISGPRKELQSALHCKVLVAESSYEICCYFLLVATPTPLTRARILISEFLHHHKYLPEKRDGRQRPILGSAKHRSPRREQPFFAQRVASALVTMDRQTCGSMAVRFRRLVNKPNTRRLMPKSANVRGSGAFANTMIILL